MNLKTLWKDVKGRRNVQGYSMKLRRRIKNRRTVDEAVFRVYVKEKLPLSALALVDMVPPEIEGIATDVVVIGEMVIPPLMVSPRAYTRRVRPLEAGISIGNWAITAGTLGWYFEKDVVALGSNAHVFAENPANPSSFEKRIVQPGKYDGGILPDDKVGGYLWHQQLYGGISDCPIAWGAAEGLNLASRLAHRRTRFKTFVEGLNKIDFAVAEPEVDYDLKIHGIEDFSGFVGLGFAGSDLASFFCKASNIIETGWSPIDVDTYLPTIGEYIHKVGRTTEYTKGAVKDDCAHGVVNYGSAGYIELDDLILTDAMLEGGDSGDAAWISLTQS